MSNFERGPGSWKFNNSLLSNHKFLSEIRYAIEALYEHESMVHAWQDFKEQVKRIAIKYARISKQNKNMAEHSLVQKLGEKPSKFFSKLENINTASKAIPSLLNPTNGHVAHSSEEKVTFAHDFYANLFSGTSHSEEATRKLLKNMKTKISPSNKEECDKPILRENVISAIKSLKNNSSPGLQNFFHYSS